jgi:hypothetical protein
MNRKLNFLVMLICLLALGLALAGCDNGSTDPESEPNTDPKKITITGIPGNITQVGIIISDQAGTVARGGEGNVSDGSITVLLYADEDKDVNWTGYGSYRVMLLTGSAYYMYTDGKPLAGPNIPEYNIAAEISTIDFSKFVKVS